MNELFSALHNEQIKLLHEIDRLCNANGIQYYLIAGSTLGAVRHKGIIPWDHDVDIGVIRDDYDRLTSDEISRLVSHGFYLSTYKNNRNHVPPHAVLLLKNTRLQYNSEIHSKFERPIQLDIFPLDYVPQRERLRRKQKKAIKRLMRIYHTKTSYDIFRNLKGRNALYASIRHMLLLASKTISLQSILKRIDEEIRRYKNCGSSIVCSMVSRYGYDKHSMPLEYYGIPKKMWFEDGYYGVPEKTHEYLTRLYGDYMVYPSKERIASLESGILYVKFSDGKVYDRR